MLRKKLSVLSFGLMVFAGIVSFVSCTSRTGATDAGVGVLTAHWQIYPNWVHSVAVVVGSEIAIGYFDLSPDRIRVGCVHDSKDGSIFLEFADGSVEIRKSNSDSIVLDGVSIVPVGIEDSLIYRYHQVVSPNLIFDSLRVDYLGTGGSGFEMTVRRGSDDGVSSVRLIEDGRSKSVELAFGLDQLLWAAVENIDFNEIERYSDGITSPRGSLDVVFYSGNGRMPFNLVSREYIAPLELPYSVLEAIYLAITDMESRDRQEMFELPCVYDYIDQLGMWSEYSGRPD